MKYLLSLQSFLEEVKSYNYQVISDDPQLVKYFFTDIKGNKYLVEFKNTSASKKGVLSTVYELLYYVEDNGSFSVSKIVNVNIFSILKTIFSDILYDFIKKFSWVKQIFFIGLSKDRERDYVSTRTRVYMRYLNMNPIPGFRINQSGNTIQLIRV